MMKNNLNVIRR